jgi:hypothetical protein
MNNEAVKQLILSAKDILERASVEADKDFEDISTLYGYPIHFCPDELLKRYLKKYDKMNVLNPCYDHAGVRTCEKELEQRSAFGIKVIKENKQ